MADHFSLDVDPDSLKLAREWFGSLSNHLSTKATTISGTPGEIGEQWTGEAATSIKGEMTGLGDLMASPLASDATAIATAIQGLEEDYRAAQTRVAELNRSWVAADTTYSSAVTAAGNDYDRSVAELSKDHPVNGGIRLDLQDSRSYAISTAATERDKTQSGLTGEYDELVAGLRTKTKALGTALVEHTPVQVPPSALSDYQKNGTYPDRPPSSDSLLAGLGLTKQYVVAQEQHDAGAAAAAELGDIDDPDDVQAYLDSLQTDSAAFRQGFLEALDPVLLARLHQQSAYLSEEDSEKYGALITALATITARGSNAELQGGYPVSSSVFDGIIAAYTDGETPQDQATGHLLLAELVAAGQGDGATWDSALLERMAESALTFEQAQREDDEYFSWVDAAFRLKWPTEVGDSWFGHAPGQGDPLTLYLDALGKDPDAALSFLSDSDGADVDRLHYLYEHPASGNALLFNTALGDTLTAATTTVGAGGPGSPEYASAEIVGDLVHYWANTEGGADRIFGLEDAITDILTTHVQAVNHAGTYDVDQLAITPYDNPELPYQQIALANLSHEDLRTILQLTFKMDYWSNDVAQDDNPDAHDFPRFTQLALAMEVAFRNDVQTQARNGESGLLETTVNQLSYNQELAVQAFTDALVGTGAERDQATQDARAALQFVTGLVKDKVPVDKLGPLGEAGSLGLDQVEELLVDTLIPETDYAGAAAEDASTEDYRRRLTSLKLVSWLEEAGALPQEHSPEAWAAANPNTSSFVNPDGSIPPLDYLYQHRNDNAQTQQQWTDFLRYYQNEGGAWLAEIDLSENYQLGWLAEHDEHEGGG